MGYFNSLWAEWGFVYLTAVLIGTGIIAIDEKITMGSGQMNILVLLTLSLVMRTIWSFCIVKYSPTLYSLRLIDRLSILLQLSATSVLILGWGQAVNVDRIVRERTRLSFIALNIILYIFTFATGFGDEGSTVFYVNITTLAGATLLITLLVQVYGYLILQRLNASSNNDIAMDGRIVKAFRKIAIVSSLLTLCFIGRFVAYIYFVADGCSSEGDDDFTCSKVLRYFIYQIPDLIPYLTLLFALSSLTQLLGSCCELLAFDDTENDGNKPTNKYHFNNQDNEEAAAQESSPLVN